MINRHCPTLALILPCYNEQEILPRTLNAVAALLEALKVEGRISSDSFALYVDDGSRDATWELISAAHASSPQSCRGLKFAGNAGHQNALYAGLLQVRDMADCAISLDADLQDDLAAIRPMLTHFAAGCELVYGVRNDRSSDTAFKRGTAHAFYRGMEMLGVKLIPDHADFRLTSRPVLEALASYSEYHLFLRGIFPSMGFRSASVGYARLARQAGESKYPLRRMLAFALSGITSFSPVPLRLAGILSAGALLLALLESLRALYTYFTGGTVPGWTSLIIALLLLGSVQLFCLAVMGEYMARMFTEVKRRPRYLIEKIL
ncbi:MAG: glycosyltransferase family 2 protein [Deltaproteobacteria bacterium]|jgi:glycosyltransferase involved in cell wall biosynthesis|nr:glycosyltransferase family 2 protein [Deltaproteobacteria bacterium]